MPVDLEEMFHALRVEGDALPLNPPQRVRSLGRRLRLMRVTATVAVSCGVIIALVAMVMPLTHHRTLEPADSPGIAARLTFATGTPNINAVAYSPDGRLLATAGGRTVGLWNAQTGASTGTLAGTGQVISVAFSPDGTTLAASDSSGDIRIWDLATASVVRTLAASRSGPVTAVAFSPDGRTVAAASEDGPVRLWPVTGAAPTLITLPNIRIIQLALSPDGHTVVAGGQAVDDQGNQKTMGIWDTTTLASAAHPPTVTRPILSVAFSPDGHTFAAGTDDGLVWIFQTGTAAPKAELVVSIRRGWNGVSSVAFSPDGRWLATAGIGGATLWNVASRARAASFSGPLDGVSSVAFSPDGRTLAGSGADGKVRLWDIPA